jgi:voltage-gated potassium channel
MRRRFSGFVGIPFLRRIGWHVRRVTRQFEGKVTRKMFVGLVAILALAAVVVTITENRVEDLEPRHFFASFYWAVTTVMGQGQSDFVTGPWGWITSWLLNLFGVAIVATVTGALVGFVIDLLLKEGQGMGAAGFNDHVVVCGWNSTARELIDELRSDDYDVRVVVIDPAERNPAGDGVYFVRGDGANEDDLKRANIDTARAAIICPRDGTDDADMHSILTVLAIEAMAPEVRTVVEVNNPKHVTHFKRADVDEVLVTSKLASRLLARTALYPGLGDLVTDMVSGGAGSELYRVRVPDSMVGKSVGEVSRDLKENNEATLLALARNGTITTNPGHTLTIELGDEVVVIAEHLDKLASLASVSEGEEAAS